MDYTINKGKIISKNGVPILPRWFCDDLLVFEKDDFGISKIEYFNSATKGSPRIFFDDMWGGLKFYIKEGRFRYKENLKDTVTMPYGFESVWEYNAYSFKYETRVINNSIFVMLETGNEVPNECSLDVEFFDQWALEPFDRGNLLTRSGVKRTWTGWEYNAPYMKNSCREEDGETHVVMATNFKFNHIKRTQNDKNVLEGPILKKNEKYIFVMSFDKTEEKCTLRAGDTLNNFENYINSQNLRYEKVIEKAPVLKSPYKALNDFFALAPLYHESVKVTSMPGAVRAKTEYYWVWGWDGMSSGYAYTYWGDKDYIPDILQMYIDTADPEEGIAHWFARDMSHVETSMAAAQGYYINLLYIYYINGGDIKPFYDFAKKIFGLILRDEVNNMGLCEGYSLFPDFRNIILEDGNDISTFNNSSTYCCINAMKILADAMKDSKTSNEAKRFIESSKENFNKVLFDEEKKYYVASADSKTLKKRDMYTAMAIKWDNNYTRDLIKGKEQAVLDFFLDNFVCKAGIAPIPAWGNGFDEDSNQGHSWWPATSEIYMRLLNILDRKDLVEQHIDWISYWTKLLMCPEGVDCYVDTDKPPRDYWSAINGAWQTYSLRAWYEGVVHSFFGIDIDEDGINIYPYSGEEMMLNNFHYNNCIIDISMKGSGNKIKKIVLNGVELSNENKISKKYLLNENTLEIYRCK